VIHWVAAWALLDSVMSDQHRTKHKWADLTDAEFVTAFDEHGQKMARLGIMWEPRTEDMKRWAACRQAAEPVISQEALRAAGRHGPG
jgi:hypothetical protein